MLCFVGWEAISPLIHRLRDPGDQLPRVFGAAFAITAVVYLAVAVLDGAAGEAPLAGLLTAAIGPSGAVLGAVVAVVLTLAASNAYLSGAAALVAVERGGRIGSSRWVLPVLILLVGVVLLTAVGAGVLSIAALVNLPTAMFIAVYLACAATGVRLLTGGVRIAAGIAGVLVAAVLVCVGPALLSTAAVAAAVLAAGVIHRTRARRRSGRFVLRCGVREDEEVAYDA